MEKQQVEMTENQNQGKCMAESNKRCYTVDELRSFLGIGRIAVYELLKKNEFRWVKIGGRYIISKASFDAWLDGIS